MIVSWNWLHDYVKPNVDVDQLAHRLAMAGLNHESTTPCEGDFAIDLEVTSNRPDCLGHIGVSREVAVLLDLPLQVESPQPATSSTPVAELAKLAIECPELCYRYSARVIRGVKIGPSPDWLAERLRAIGQPTVNNIVDITNYVMMESGQPLHAFDLSQLAGAEIRVREARAGEPFTAIDHKQYDLEPGMCVIADAEKAVALGGVMGGAESEVSNATSDLLVESAEFAPLSIRTTARKLKLHSPSSYRFERGVDPRGVDWASRRCCELILELAGGELAEGVLEAGRPIVDPPSVTLRFGQLLRVLGIELASAEAVRILTALGCQPLRVEEVAEQHHARIAGRRRKLGQLGRAAARRVALQGQRGAAEDFARSGGDRRMTEDADPFAAARQQHRQGQGQEPGPFGFLRQAGPGAVAHRRRPVAPQGDGLRRLPFPFPHVQAVGAGRAAPIDARRRFSG